MQEKNKQKVSNSGFILILLICIGIGFCSGLMMPKYFDSVPGSHGTPIALAILVLIVIISFFASIILHEAGHLVFGLLTGYKFSSFRIGSLMLVRLGKKLKFKIHSVKGTGGQCLLVPPQIKDGRFPYVLYNLGGVIFNIIFATVAGFLTYILRESIYVATLFFVFSVLNLTMGISNGIPVSTMALDNDGKNALSLGRNPEAMRALWIQLKINSETAEGKRLSEMPEEWFELPDEASLGNALIASLITFHTNRLMDMKRFDEAAELIAKYKDTPALPGIYKALMTLDEVTLKALNGAPYSEIASLFTKNVHTVMNAMRSFPSIIRTKYVFALLAESNPQGAAKAYESFDKAAKHYPYSTDVEAEREIMEIAKEKYEQNLKAEEQEETEE